MYKEISVLGKILGWIICALTIEGIDLTDSFILNIFIISPIISKILNIVSYYTCNIIVYQILNINESTIGSIGYWFLYAIYVLLLYVVLYYLKNNNVIPIITHLDMNIFYGIVKFFNNALQGVVQNIIKISINT